LFVWNESKKFAHFGHSAACCMLHCLREMEAKKCAHFGHSAANKNASARLRVHPSGGANFTKRLSREQQKSAPSNLPSQKALPFSSLSHPAQVRAKNITRLWRQIH
jgi:hypothetical protein